MPTDDLSSLLTASPTGVMRHGIAKLLSWNPDTFENVVLWNGGEVTNMKIGNPVDALSYTSDMWVSVTVIDASGSEGMAQCFISGRIIDPGGSAAADAIAFMRGTLAREISAEIFADRIFSDFDTAIAERNSSTFGNPTNGADPGPEVTVDIQTGAALVILSANMRLSTEDTLAANSPEYASLIGFEVSGASSVAADESKSINAVMYKYNNAGMTNTDGVVMGLGNTFVYPVTGLNPGLNTFTMKYATWPTATTGLQVDDRSLTVIGF